MEHVIKYNATPPADSFRELDASELAEIIREIRQAEASASRAGDGYYDNWQVDIGAATRAAELQDAFGARIFIARDEDGFYFAHEALPQIVNPEFAVWLATTSFAGQVEPGEQWDTSEAWPSAETIRHARACYTAFVAGDIETARISMVKAQEPFV